MSGLRIFVATVVGATVLLSTGAQGTGVIPKGDSATGTAVRDVSGKRPRPCSPVDPDHEPFVAGGCFARANTSRATINVRTPIGAVRFGDCNSNIDITFSRDGRFWIDNIYFGGKAPCSDLWPCSPPEVIAMKKSRIEVPPPEHVPVWKGSRLRPDGRGFTGSLEFCVDSCLGRYRGPLDVRFVPLKGGGWRMRATSAGVGYSALEVDGSWDLLDRGLRRPAKLAFAREG